ncbi:thiol reductant ABC exporter subunit CydD [Domibacillus epiphyticus]|uniref:Thiol reductant ABC exporter subunit CydD n=1 Tax=Domibacillus epiphyticus TaxID=1714355 RepID=A0A1V2AB12_9BACI|nr:thiol reductant ABC exporter subunit CydD [Domibacillus epiphyticus]OMP68185.1 thiol reductant ABC exporter subunit CydD [Domibacillus epiphyticus]
MDMLRKWAFEQKTMIVLLFVSSLLTGALIIGQAYFFVTIVDRVFLKGQSFQEIVPLLWGLAAVLASRAALTYLNSRTGVKMSSNVKRRVRKMLLEKYTKNPIQAAIQGQSGGKVSVMMDAVDEIDSYYSKYIPQVIHTSIVPFMILAVVLYEHVYSGLIMIVTAPFIPLFFIIIGIKTKAKSEEQLDKLAAFSGRFLDTLQGLTTLKLFGRAAKQRELIEQSSIDFRDATMTILKIAFISTLMLEFISTLSIGLIALEVGLRLVVFENITFAAAFFVLVLAPEYYLSLKELGSAFHTGRSSMGAAKKVMDELAETEHSVIWGTENVVNMPQIELRSAGFQYGEGFALKNINVVIPPKARVAIVGRSGSGKTTLLHVIAGLFDPMEGKILLNGRTRSHYSEKSWFDQLSYISQRPYLFSGTIAENIAIGGRYAAGRDEVEEAAKKSGISGLVESFENGYDTPIGEAGRGISGGEKQRIALARAFFKKPSVILFDEPTTGLDLQTERILQQSINELSQTSTVITVAHRLHTIKEAEMILFLDKGELVASGSHEELMESVPEYRHMVSVQQGGGAE